MKWVWISGPPALEMELRNDQFGRQTYLIIINILQKFTKTAQATGLENIGLRRPHSGHLALRPVLSPSHITLENNGKILRLPDRENAFAGASGGGDGPEIQPSLVDAALICKEFLNLRHVIECGLLSGLFVRPDRCRWPRW